MPDYVLDTHTCVFALAAPKKLGTAAKRALKRVESGAERAWVPAAVVAEILMLHELGRIEVGLAELEEIFDSVPPFCFLPLDMAQLQHFASMAAIRDPFDRLIVSAARAVDAKLITKDGRISELSVVRTVW